MIIDFDSTPIINEHQAIVEYYNQFDFFENPIDYIFFHVRYLEDGIGGCSGGEEPICEYYSYEYLEEQDREMREAEEQRQLEEQQRKLEEQQQYEKVYEVHEVTNDKGFTYWVNDDGRFCYEDGRLVPPTDMAHLGAGLGTYPGYVLQ